MGRQGADSDRYNPESFDLFDPENKVLILHRFPLQQESPGQRFQVSCQGRVPRRLRNLIIEKAVEILNGQVALYGIQIGAQFANGITSCSALAPGTCLICMMRTRTILFCSAGRMAGLAARRFSISSPFGDPGGMSRSR